MNLYKGVIKTTTSRSPYKTTIVEQNIVAESIELALDKIKTEIEKKKTELAAQAEEEGEIPSQNKATVDGIVFVCKIDIL